MILSGSFFVGRRGTNSTLQSNFHSTPRQSIGNINNDNDKRSHGVNIYVNNNNSLKNGLDDAVLDHTNDKSHGNEKGGISSSSNSDSKLSDRISSTSQLSTKWFSLWPKSRQTVSSSPTFPCSAQYSLEREPAWYLKSSGSVPKITISTPSTEERHPEC